MLPSERALWSWGLLGGPLACPPDCRKVFLPCLAVPLLKFPPVCELACLFVSPSHCSAVLLLVCFHSSLAQASLGVPVCPSVHLPVHLTVLIFYLSVYLSFGLSFCLPLPHPNGACRISELKGRKMLAKEPPGRREGGGRERSQPVGSREWQR